MAGSVVFIDDDAFVTKVVSLTLAAHGIEVHSADNAADGHRLVAKYAPALVIVDVVMPGEDGITAVKRMRADGVTAPIIVATALADDSTAAAAVAAGATSLMHKPFDLPTLAQQVQDIIGPS